MELFGHLAVGFSQTLLPANLLFCLLGVLIGTLVGVLPGIGPLGTVAMLLPITFGLPPVGSIIMLAGIYYGAQYGGSTTAILVNLPGEPSSVVTCIDGYQMARQGRAGPALAIAAIGSFIAGSAATLLIAVLAGPLAELALQFGPAEFFSLMVFGLIAAIVLASGSILKALAMILLGLLLGLVGIDVNSGDSRYTLGFVQLVDGISFVPVALGMFGIGDIVANLQGTRDRTVVTSKITGLMPRMDDFKAALPAILRGGAVGSFLGILPGGGAALASFSAYALEKRISRSPERFGKGAIEGLAAPESANNAGAQTSFIPMLTLGIPSNALMALMIGALMIQGIQPGPLFMTQQPELFWGLVASMWIGNLMLLVINLPLVGLWVRLLRVPYAYLFPAIIVFSVIGVYSINNSTFDVLLVSIFGVLGYFFNRVGAEPAPLLLAFVLGPMVEENLRRALIYSDGSFLTFVERPISAGLLLASIALLVAIVLPSLRSKREQAFKDA